MYEVLTPFLSIIAILLGAYIFYLKHERGVLLREISDEISGSSNGKANQYFSFNKKPKICVSTWVKEMSITDKEISRLKKDKAIKITDKEIWVKWRHIEDFSESYGDSRCFIVEIDEDGNSTVIFGDGKNGMIPPVGDNVKARYQTGCGPEGNVPSGQIRPVMCPSDTHLISPVSATPPQPSKGKNVDGSGTRTNTGNS